MSKPLDTELKEAVKDRIRDGDLTKDIAVQFDISPNSIFNIKKAMKAAGEKLPYHRPGPQGKSWRRNEEPPHPDRTMYICDLGHRFISNLTIDKAMCVSCKSRKLEIDRPLKVIEKRV